MSLSVSPAIEVDCRVPRGVAIAVLSAGLAAALAPVVLFGWSGLAGTLICMALIVFLHNRVRWLQPWDFTATWAADGVWWLREGQGAAVAARLRADSRIYPAGLWLRWDSPEGPRQALLLRRGREAEAIRCLGVRLRLQGIAGPASDSAAP